MESMAAESSPDTETSPAPGPSPGLSPRAKVTVWAAFFGLAASVTALDLWTKEIAFEALKVGKIEFREDADSGIRFVVLHYDTPDGRPKKFPVIENLFEFEASMNIGAFSGWFGQHTGVLAFISFAALFIITAILAGHLRRPEHFDIVFVVALGLLLGGTFGNFYDRYFLRAVRDFIKWFVVIGRDEWVWPNFNLADSSICVGVGLIFIHLWRDSRRQKRAALALNPG